MTIAEQYREFIFSGDPSIRNFFLLRSIAPMILSVTSYILFVTKIGPAIMKNRKPVQLRKLIIVYNFALVLYYIYFVVKGLLFMPKLGVSFICGKLDSETNPEAAQFYLHGYQLMVVRYIELFDTVFLVMSKKQIDPLHVFHHAIVPVFAYFGFRSEKSAYLSIFMGFNSIVHIIMYTYYAVAALGPKYQKYIWWKKYLTTLQIFQFFIMMFYLMLVSAIGCTTSKFTLIFCSSLTVAFFFLFIRYYRTIYIERNRPHQNGVHHVAHKNKQL
ncbi:elongation of very long chain fatty acids protein 7-like [Uloborus diversus]|uniref:elongation of very long chain fatty acids protein 7-like n=1 Tax=Uloborus diversus TaxID=327109 RepID=UPI002409E438|nr:elongation of very long chain fatty acids protein 7-like [Uloborus diversus]XP_054724130.1 elongation of very long chain fatty acids protein 7-like [Uloborus diversus]